MHRASTLQSISSLTCASSSCLATKACGKCLAVPRWESENWGALLRASLRMVSICMRHSSQNTEPSEQKLCDRLQLTTRPRTAYRHDLQFSGGVFLWKCPLTHPNLERLPHDLDKFALVRPCPITLAAGPSCETCQGVRS